MTLGGRIVINTNHEKAKMNIHGAGSSCGMFTKGG